ncbi:MAG: HAD family phosphatase [Chloroflexi bacterium]|nr:HAD family phosphatase [Chloroflexota bacterium]MDA1146148.1 HAD family phosphatase [Chloroflexota bacterium]
MTVIETVLFDLDGVLSHYDFERRLAVLAAETGVDAAEIERRAFSSGFDARADDGAYDSAGYLAEFSRLLDAPVSTELWVAARQAGMSQNLEVIELARAVGERATIAMLTNNGPVLRDHLARMAPDVAALFGERAFFSCQFGTGKTGPTVFGLVLAEVSGEPSTTLFIDDTPEYLENARLAGLQANLFQGADVLRTELSAHGLL